MSCCHVHPRLLPCTPHYLTRAWLPSLAPPSLPHLQAQFVAVAVNASGGFDNPSDLSPMVTVGAWTGQGRGAGTARHACALR